MLAPVYVNDFSYGGRVKRVIMQADAPYRMGPEALQHMFTPSTENAPRSGTPAMIPLSNVVQANWQISSPALTRYNGYAAIEIVGSPSAGHASGDAMEAMQNIVDNDLPQRLRRGLDRPVVSGNPFRQRGHRADGAVGVDRVSVPGRAV